MKKFLDWPKKFSTHENKSRKININFQRVDLHLAWWNDFWACYPKNWILKIISTTFVHYGFPYVTLRMRNLGTGTTIIQKLFDKSTIEKVHIKFCKQSLNVPWYTENIVCRAELGWYPLSIDIKASICSYWQRLKHSTNNALLREALISICNKKYTFLQHSTEKVEFKRTSNPATHQECTISYKEKP